METPNKTHDDNTVHDGNFTHDDATVGLVARFITSLTVERNLSSNTIRAYSIDLRQFSDWLRRGKFPCCRGPRTMRR